MYSHGSSSSTRVGVDGKQGHGGRNYRPPPERRDRNAAPPPLKECHCLLQFHVEEYQVPQPSTGRIHQSLGGRDQVLLLERSIRNRFTCHIIIPGKKQGGPVAIVGDTYNQTFPAAAWFLQQLARYSDSNQYQNGLPGRIQLHVQTIQDPGVVGVWHVYH